MHPNLILFGLTMAGAAGIAWAVMVAVMAWSLAHPPRMTDGKAAWVLRRLAPSDLGLPFEEIGFDIRDQAGKPLRLAAWWIPSRDSDGRCAMLIHGYADAKVGAIAWAPLWHTLGFNLIVPDLRAHGESGGKASSAGCFERSDLVQVIDDLRARKPDETRRMVLFGISMGAAVAAATAIDATDFTAVVMESPYADFRRAAMAHMDRMGAPGRPLQRQAIALAEWFTGADYDSVRPSDLIPRIPCPVLLIAAGNDPFIQSEDRESLARAMAAHPQEHGNAEIWTVDGVEHLMTMSADLQGYRTTLSRFLATTSAISDRSAIPAP
jgi:pimeloyl-ACP methyl ester carboxylesterase